MVSWNNVNRRRRQSHGRVRLALARGESYNYRYTQFITTSVETHIFLWASFKGILINS